MKDIPATTEIGNCAQLMTGDMIARAAVTSEFLKSLSHPARLVILCRLAEGPAHVNELEDVLGMPQAMVSKQLARLRAAGLVQASRDGRAVSYTLADARTARIMAVLHEEFCV